MLFVTVIEPRIHFALVWFLGFLYYFGVFILLSFSLKLCKVFCQICVQVQYSIFAYFSGNIKNIYI